MRDAFFHFYDPSKKSDKVYAIHLRAETNGYSVYAFHGKRGTLNLTVVPPKFYGSAGLARDYFDKECHRREFARGYSTTTASVVWPHATPAPWNSLGSPVAARPAPGRPAAPKSRAKTKTQATAAKPLVTPPAWALACFSAVPDPTRARVADVLAACFPSDAMAIRAASVAPEPRPGVDWLRVVFSRLPVSERKPAYRKMSMVLHPDHGGDERLMQDLIATYSRFAT